MDDGPYWMAEQMRALVDTNVIRPTNVNFSPPNWHDHEGEGGIGGGGRRYYAIDCQDSGLDAGCAFGLSHP